MLFRKGLLLAAATLAALLALAAPPAAAAAALAGTVAGRPAAAAGNPAAAGHASALAGHPAAGVGNLAAVAGDSAAEAELLDLLNAERRRAGLEPLVLDPALTTAARLKAQDEIDQGYFGHESPTYGSPANLLRLVGARYAASGENLAAGLDTAGAHARFMGSPQHRANILDPRFRAVGIGVVPGGPYGAMIVELFAG